MGLFGSQQAPATDDVENVVAANTTLEGTLRSDGGVRIDGTLEGLVECAGNVVIGEGARVVANITARNVIVAGLLKGNIDATGKLEILPTGQIHGDISVSSVAIHEGGIFHGKSLMRGLAPTALEAGEMELEPAHAPGQVVIEPSLLDDTSDRARKAHRAP
jgi:cytoskeletal protein CcmA (bactofilin family)